MDAATIDQSLLSALREEGSQIDKLIELVEASDDAPAKKLATASLLEVAQLQTAEAIQEFRSAVSDEQRRTTERSIRQYVLAALEEIGTPQPAGFLEEFVLATEQVSLNTRGFGALRRDERRAWVRRPGHRVAYVVACLDPQGAPASKWMARSDWPVAERLIVSGSDDYLSLSQIDALHRALKDASDMASRTALEVLLDEHLDQADRWPGLSAARTNGEKKFSRALSESLTAARQVVEQQASSIAVKSSNRSAEEQIWGWA